MKYFDTAYLAKCYLNEGGSSEVRKLAEEAEGIACCRLGQAELAAVFHRHLREGKISKKTFRVVWEQFEADEALGLWHWLPFPEALFQEAALVLKELDAKVFVRASDAIHLLSALSGGFREIYTNDRHMLAAAATFGLAGKNVL